MATIELGSSKLVNELHPQKARSPMEATGLEITTFVNELHLRKAECPMEIIELGIHSTATDWQL